MTPGEHIRYVRRASLDTKRWDRCLEESANEFIYAYSAYLDHMAKSWDALILGDYDAIMPITWNRKWGIRYLYQPPLTPQLGIFSRHPVDDEMVRLFLEAIPHTFRFAEIFLNEANRGAGLQEMDNFVLNLHKPYETLAGAYRPDLVKNLKRAARNELTYSPFADLHRALEMHQLEYGARTPHVGPTDYRQFEKLCMHLRSSGAVFLRAVSSSKKELLSVALLLQTKHRLYLLESTTPQRGRELQANHFLLDELIREFSGRELDLDFVGSSIPGIAHFYKNFGGVNRPSFFYYMNRLPWPLRLLKARTPAHLE